MKAFIYSLLVVLIGSAVTFYVNRKSPDLRYQLSSPIPIAGTEPKNVQQLEVANLGNAPAQKVQIQVRKKLTDLSVIRDSESDTYKQYARADGVEIIYDVLHPGRTVKLIFTLAVTSLEERDLTIRHQDGEAHPILSSATTRWSLIILYLVLILMMAFNARSAFKSHLESQAKWRGHDILRRKKPISITEDEWRQIRSSALSNAFEKPRLYSEPSDWDGYLFLSSNRPQYLSDEEWHKLTKLLTSQLEEFFDGTLTSAQGSHLLGKLKLLLQVKKPQAVGDASWLEIQKKTSDTYVRTALYVHNGMSDTSSLAKALKEQRPEGVLENDWNWYLQKVADLYLIEVLADSADGEIACSTEDVSTTLQQSDAYKLKRAFYRRQMMDIPDVSTANEAKAFLERTRPSWMADTDYERLKRRAKQCVELEGDVKRYGVFNSAIEGILSGIELPDKVPGEVTEEDWRRLGGIDDRVRAVAEANAKRAEELAKAEKDMGAQRSKVVRQLDVIDTFLKDAGVLDRLEEYENVFAPGNLANLRELAALRRSG